MDEKLLEYVKKLPDRVRQAYVLRKFAGYSMSKIAKLMRVTTTTVGRYVYEGREALIKFAVDNNIDLDQIYSDYCKNQS